MVVDTYAAYSCWCPVHHKCTRCTATESSITRRNWRVHWMSASRVPVHLMKSELDSDLAAALGMHRRVHGGA